MYINEYGKNSKGQYHRKNGPAIEFSNGDKFWYKEGKLHRDDGPAGDYLDGYKAWWLEDIPLEKEKFNSWIKRIQFY